ncbi:MAG TPA: hypothetical protein PK467_11480, partial [Candidatus Wallbacteria bacterium]|nr:hypothetical protein [Candidatus Wallbacteria bacterium]
MFFKKLKINLRLSALILIFLLSFTAPSFSFDFSIKPFEEFKLIAYKLNTYKQVFNPENKSISPGLDHLKKQYESTSEELGAKKDELISIFNLAVSKDERQAIRAVTDYICNVNSSDPSYPAFNSLRGMFMQKIDFEIISSGDNSDRKDFLQKIKTDLDKKILIGSTPVITSGPKKKPGKNKVPIYISFHWHMHQPVYWPYEDMVTTHNRGVYSYSLLDVMYSREGAYTSWPYEAVKAAADAGLANAGAQVSFSGSLIENLNAIKKAGLRFNDWEASYSAGRNMKTALGNPRLDMVSFGFHHPLMALIDYEDIRKQIQA